MAPNRIGLPGLEKAAVDEMQEIAKILSMDFVLRALTAGLIISVCSALLGVVLVLKRYALIGHGLGDIGFASLSLALALQIPPLLVSTPIVIAASFIIMAYSQKKGVHGDIAIGIAATASLAFGIMVTALSGSYNADVYNYMFGSILATSQTDVWLSLVIGLLVAGLFVLFYNRVFLIASDEEYAKTTGINVTAYQFLISLLTALTVVIGMRIMGTLLISSLIIFPAVSARRIAGSFKSMTILAGIISVVCFLLGTLLSVVFQKIPIGAGIVIINFIVLCVLELARRLCRRI